MEIKVVFERRPSRTAPGGFTLCKLPPTVSSAVSQRRRLIALNTPSKVIFKNGSYAAIVPNCPPFPISGASECKYFGLKPRHQDGGSADDRRGRTTLLVRMRPIRVGRKLASARRCHAIHQRNTAHAEESRIKIPCPVPPAVARRPVHRTVVSRYLYSVRCIVRRTLLSPSSSSSST